MRVLVTGARGFLGRHMISHLGGGYETLSLTHQTLDITDAGAVMDAVCGFRPDAVVHCAAISSTAYAKDHPDESMAVNVGGPVNVALACRRCGSALYVMGSDQTVGPPNIYGEHKKLMEEKVLEVLPSAVALRLTWMFERYDELHPHTDIVSRLTEASRTGTPIKASTREYRAMTDVDDVCRNIIRSFGRLPGGVYNFGSKNKLDTYSTLCRIVELAGLEGVRIVPDDSWGRSLAMDCSALRKYGLEFPETIESVVNSLKKQ